MCMEQGRPVVRQYHYTAKCRVNAQDKDGKTALHHACATKWSEVGFPIIPFKISEFFHFLDCLLSFFNNSHESANIDWYIHTVL